MASEMKEHTSSHFQEREVCVHSGWLVSRRRSRQRRWQPPPTGWRGHQYRRGRRDAAPDIWNSELWHWWCFPRLVLPDHERTLERDQHTNKKVPWFCRRTTAQAEAWETELIVSSCAELLREVLSGAWMADSALSRTDKSIESDWRQETKCLSDPYLYSLASQGQALPGVPRLNNRTCEVADRTT